MISKSRLQEFGFADIDSFPKRLSRHEVTLSLPSAMEHGVAPVSVEIEDGLAVPTQRFGSSNGMIIRSDGMMLHIVHRDPRDASSVLEAHFIREIPYDVRVEVCHVMRRAVLAEPSLGEIWQKIVVIWQQWFPPAVSVWLKQAGVFGDVSKAWEGVQKLTGQLLDQIALRPDVPLAIRIRTVVQTEDAFRRGWLGEELTADDVSFDAVRKEGRQEYFSRRLLEKMRQVLSAPIFHPHSTFKLFYESRHAHTVKLVVVPPRGHEKSVGVSAGIELRG